MSSRPRILIADDHTLIADLCQKILEPEFSVVGTVGNGRAMVRAALELKPDLIVVDVAMPILNGLDAGQQVKRSCRATKLVYLTMNSDAQLVAEAFRRGASGYLLKTSTSSELVLAVREVLRGKSYLSQMLPKSTINYLRRQHKEMVEEEARLTRREREVLQLLAEGKAMKEVGYILNITTRTVAFHKYGLMGKLGAQNDADLVRFAVRNYLVAASG